MHYGKINDCDIANGEGVRVTLFVSGCRNHCKNCFNPETWDFNYGNLYTEETEDEIIRLLSRSFITGLTLLGGEPMEPENQRELVKLLRRVKHECQNKTIWCYTGYVFEDIQRGHPRCSCEVTEEMLSLIDILVDGKYEDDLKDISLKFRGSSNQRILDLNMIYLMKKAGFKT